MKKRIIPVLIVSSLIFTAIEASAVSSRKQYFTSPQIGAWYGPITPVGDTGEHVNTNLAPGIFFRYNMPWEPLKIGIDTSYQIYKSEGVDYLRLIPVYLNFLYLVPFNFPVKLQLKGGGGMCRVHMGPDNINQWDPMFMSGVEVSFPAGKMANIALRIDYLYIYERYITGATQDAYVINAGISLYFNLNM